MTKNKCNICGYPAHVVYEEIDEETGKRVQKKHVVYCLGHDVMPWQHNKHPHYTKYQQLFIRQRKASRQER